MTTEPMYDEDDAFDPSYESDLEDADPTQFVPKFKRIDTLDLDAKSMEEFRVDQLIEMYINERNQLATDRKGWKAREARIKVHMSIISMVLRDRGDNVGVDSFKTASGTAFRRVTEKFSISDWQATTEYIQRTGNFQVLQKRVSPNAVKEIRELDGELPPGVANMVEVDFAVRSPAARKSKSSVGQE